MNQYNPDDWTMAAIEKRVTRLVNYLMPVHKYYAKVKNIVIRIAVQCVFINTQILITYLERKSENISENKIEKEETTKDEENKNAI